MTGARILVVDDEEGIRSFLAEALETEGHEVTRAENGDAAWDALSRSAYALLITDLKMPGMDGMTLLRKVKAAQPETEVVVLTAFGSIETAVEAMQAGAFDYLQKPVGSPAELRLLVQRALERRALLTHKASAGASGSTPRLTWGAPSMQPVVEALGKVAPTLATVLLLGESGTGKEVAARFIHAHSPRADAPFVAVNSAALSDTLLESELFGHEKGAFTGAHARRRGRLELAAGGTFFLDEVGELRLDLQAKLLRVLQEKRFERLGGTQTLVADVRWIAATNRDLRAMIARGAFREDLYHRLAVFPIALPPLRERREDIAPLAQVLLEQIGAELGRPRVRLSEPALERLRAASFPGNVRELRNLLERATILADTDVIGPELLPLAPDPVTRAVPVEVTPAEPSNSEPRSVRPLEVIEREAIQDALQSFGGNRKRAAEALGLGLRTLYDKLKRYGLG